MKAFGGAFYPIMAIRKKYHDGADRFPQDIAHTIKHEETHMKDQLWMGLVFWAIVYYTFYIIYGYRENPFERHARAVSDGETNYYLYGWRKYMKKKK